MVFRLATETQYNNMKTIQHSNLNVIFCQILHIFSPQWDFLSMFTPIFTKLVNGNQYENNLYHKRRMSQFLCTIGNKNGLKRNTDSLCKF